MDIEVFKNLIEKRKQVVNEKLENICHLVHTKIGVADLHDINYQYESSLILIDTLKVLQLIDYQLHSITKKLHEKARDNSPRIEFYSPTPNENIEEHKTENYRKNNEIHPECLLSSNRNNDHTVLNDSLDLTLAPNVNNLGDSQFEVQSQSLINHDGYSSRSSIPVKLPVENNAKTSFNSNNPFLNLPENNDKNEQQQCRSSSRNCESISDIESEDLPYSGIDDDANSLDRASSTIFYTGNESVSTKNYISSNSKSDQSDKINGLKEFLNNTSNDIQLEFTGIGKNINNNNNNKKKGTTSLKSCYVLNERQLKENDRVYVSYVYSPSNFYVQIDLDGLKQIENKLNETLNDKYPKIGTNCWNKKSDIKKQLGNNYCFAFIEQWYRAEIIDWLEESQTDVLILLVDYGKQVTCHFKYLKRLTKSFSSIPKFAIKCHLAHIDPPDNSTNWPEKTIEKFSKLTSWKILGRKFFTIYYIINSPGSYGVDLIDANYPDKGLSHILVDLGLARDLETEFEINDEEFELEEKNCNELVMGYELKDLNRVCIYNKNGSCYKGARCKFEHTELLPNGCTTDKKFISTQTFNTYSLPKPGENIFVLITGYINITRYYVQILLDGKTDERYSNLQKKINSPQEIYNYKPFKIDIAEGEIVLANVNGVYYRGIYLGSIQDDTNSSMVFLLDYGITQKIANKNIKQIKDEFLFLAAQAIECYLQNYQIVSNIDHKRAEEFFNQHLRNMPFAAYVEESENPLGLQILDSKGVNIGELLVNYGFAKRSNNGWSAGVYGPA